MKLLPFKSYTNNSSDLAIKIHSRVHYSNRGHIKFKATLFNKKNNIVYEVKTYKININTPNDFNWRLL